METKFFDIHCHAFNLSHPNLLAFISRFKLDSGILYALIGSNNDSKSKPINRIANLLAFMENDMGDYFLIWEYFLKNDKNLFKNGKLTINGNIYDKIVLTPLMVDFGSNKLRNRFKIFYNVPPQKPIIDQVIDVFNGKKNILQMTSN